MPILPGLGIGGVAIANAARPAVENIIGGLTLFADKPVKVGDFCRFGNEEGFIEEIGLRSTRIRKLDDTLVSVPNAQFSQLDLENRTRRRKFLYRTELQFRYETKRDQLRYLLAMLRKMLLSHPKTILDKMRVRFLGFGTHSLDIEIFVHFWRYRKISISGLWILSGSLEQDSPSLLPPPISPRTAKETRNP